MKSLKNSTCFATYCRSGYAGNRERASLFSAPKDEELFLKWQKIIPRGDRLLTHRDVLCEKHFTDEDIIREWKSGDVSVQF